MNESKENLKNHSKSVEKTDHLLIVSAEASSCLYAKLFMKQWKNLYPGTCFFGIGDREMQSRGMDCRGLAENLAVVGFQEVLSHLKEIRKSFNDLLKMAEQRKPRFALLLDYPGFNLRLAVRLKKLKIPVVYYLSPQVWAWKEGRVRKIKKYVDDMMVVFPFEVDFYKKHGIEAHFVGHPLVEVIKEEKLLNSKDLFLNEKKITLDSQKKIVLGLMPGSRKAEIKHNLKIQWQTAGKLKEKYDIEVKLLTAPGLGIDFLKGQIEEFMGLQSSVSRTEKCENLKTEFKSMKLDFSGCRPPGFKAGKNRHFDSVELLKAQPTEMIKNCDLILAASGTATLQVALCGKPMVVMYSMNSLTAFLAKFFVGHLDHYCIVNIIAGGEVVPEFIQSKANPSALSGELEKLLKFPEVRNKMLEAFEKISQQLGEGKATANLVQFLREKYGGF